MDEDDPMRKGVDEAGAKPQKTPPSKRQGAQAPSQALTMHGGAISGVGMVGSGGTVNIIYHQQGGAQIAPAPPQERMAAWIEASLQRYEARRKPFKESAYRLNPFPNGHYFCAYDLSGDLQRYDLADFYDVLSDANIWHTDHPPFWVYDADPFTRIRISQKALDGAVESWSGRRSHTGERRSFLWGALARLSSGNGLYDPRAQRRQPLRDAEKLPPS